MIKKNWLFRTLVSLFVASMLGCAQTYRLETPGALAGPLSTETATPAPTFTLSPSPTPAYSYLPAISISNATQVVQFDRYSGAVSSLAFSPNGRYLAAAFENGAGILWDISGQKGWREWSDAPKEIFAAKGPLSFSSDSHVLATGGTLLELPSRRTIQELPGTVTFSPIGRSLVVSDWMTLSLWDFDGDRWALRHEQTSGGAVSAAFSPDGSLLAEALHWGASEGVNIWKVADHTLLYSFPPPEHVHPAHFNTLAYAFFAYSPDNHFIATGTRDQPVVRIWDLQTGKLVRDLNPMVRTAEGDYYVPEVECVAFSQESKVLILVGYNSVIFKKLPEGEYINMLKVDPDNMSPASYVTTCAASQDGRLLAVGNNGGEVSIWGVSAPLP